MNYKEYEIYKKISFVERYEKLSVKFQFEERLDYSKENVLDLIKKLGYIAKYVKNEDIKNNNERSINILENEFQEANSIIEKFIEEIQFDFEGNILEYEKNILKYGEEILPNYMKKSQAERLKKD